MFLIMCIYSTYIFDVRRILNTHVLMYTRQVALHSILWDVVCWEQHNSQEVICVLLAYAVVAKKHRFLRKETMLIFKISIHTFMLFIYILPNIQTRDTYILEVKRILLTSPFICMYYSIGCRRLPKLTFFNVNNYELWRRSHFQMLHTQVEGLIRTFQCSRYRMWYTCVCYQTLLSNNYSTATIRTFLHTESPFCLRM